MKQRLPSPGADTSHDYAQPKPPLRRSLLRRLTPYLAFAALACLRPVAAQPTSDQPDLPIDAAVRSRVIDSLKTKLTQKYLDLPVAQQMSEFLDARRAARAYDQITSAKTFAETLTTDLRSISRDLHLTVHHSVLPVPELPDTPPAFPPGWLDHAIEEAGRVYNFGFLTVEILSGNVGYVKLVGFPPPEIMEKTMAAVMTTIAYTDALIVDVRENTGGAPASVSLLMSYFLEAEPITINTIYWRFQDRTDTFTTTLDLPARRYTKRLFALTGPSTFSAGEEFAYDLKAFGRATLVGTTTAGAANPAIFQRLDEHFDAFIPAGRVINPITGTNWERVGVAPDIVTTDSRALQTAYVGALESIINQPPRPFHTEESAKLAALLTEQQKILKNIPPRERPPHANGSGH